MTGLSSSRRQFLKAAGVSIALPSLESLAAPVRKDSGEPMRMVCISSALGMYPGAFFPKSFGADYELSPTLQPLAKLRDQFTVFSHMDHPGIFSKHGAMKSVPTRRRCCLRFRKTRPATASASPNGSYSPSTR